MKNNSSGDVLQMPPKKDEKKDEKTDDWVKPVAVSQKKTGAEAGFYVVVQYSASQLCSELQKLESWSAALP